VLAVADVLFSIEPQPKKCAMLMQVTAQIRLAQFGVATMSPDAVSLSKASAVSVTQWAIDPEFGNRALQGLLGQLGRDMVSALPASPAR
jgi:hypothetical protein